MQKPALAVSPHPLPIYQLATQPEDPSVNLVRAWSFPAFRELVSTRLTYL